MCFVCEGLLTHLEGARWHKAAQGLSHRVASLTLSQNSVAPVRNPPKKVVVVDDSHSMRTWLCHVLDNDTRLHVAGEAANAHEARAVIRAVDPDVITLDINMPGMSGLDFLERLMRLRPKPVVMVSSATKYGSAAAIKALSLGAVDCIPKPNAPDLRQAKRDLVRRVFAAACSQPRLAQRTRRALPGDLPMAGRMPIILIGASTGGVTALDVVLRGLNPKGPPVVIVQHMPSDFLISFSEMLNRNLDQEVGLLRDGMELKPGQVMLGPVHGHNHTHVTAVGGRWHGFIRPIDTQCLHHPSIDVLFASAQAHARDTIAVILTGLGRDGAVGIKSLRDSGARTIGQNEASSVVYGMPRAAVELDGIERQCPLDAIGPAVNDMVALHQIQTRRYFP